MTEASRKRKAENIKKNCGSCIHKEVCAWKGAYDTEVGAIIHEAQHFSLIQYDVKCKHHMCAGGDTHNLLFADMEEIIDA